MLSLLLPLLLLSSSEPAALVRFASADGMARLSRSAARVDFPHLANEFEAQENKAFCGIASATIVLNALRARDPKYGKPEDPRLFPDSWHTSLITNLIDPLFGRYTQGDLFTPASDAVKTRAQILGEFKSPGAARDAGLQLRQLGAFLEALGLEVTVRVASAPLDLARARAELRQNLSTEGDYAIVNYDRKVFGQHGGGHISPLGAYDAESDSFLILDVNPTDHPWVWVSAAELFKAMATKDKEEHRGYLLVKEGKKAR